MIVIDYKSYSQNLPGHKIVHGIATKWFINKVQNWSKESEKKLNKKPEMKYILQWTSASNVPFVYMNKGQKGFIDRKCPHTNCFVTSNRSLLGDIKKFDAIAFCGTEVKYYEKEMLPLTRSPHQKYIFATIESSHYYPICSNLFDNYFNWTWTFRLDSDVRWGYMSIRDKNNNIIGPNKIMTWLKPNKMDPVSEEFKNKLKSKKKAVAWFVSNCYDKVGRRIIATYLKQELEKKYNLTVDIYGACDSLKCPSPQIMDCLKMLQDDYYFYLSFENSFSEDYVTEKLLKAVTNNVVPIVYGGANYTRFLPDGSYLNARLMTVKQLAAKIDELIRNPDQYANYFRWKNHYSYHSLDEDPDTDEYWRPTVPRRCRVYHPQIPCSQCGHHRKYVDQESIPDTQNIKTLFVEYHAGLWSDPTHPDDEVEAMYKEITKAMHSYKTHYTVVMGDFNVRLKKRCGEELREGQFGAGATERQRTDFGSFFETEHLYIMNSFFK
ncbi:hypothetical protein evm_003774 [Chilo suppressalis]|nr:hypothetical protein evm_003774 [Chilo suppressalis]